MNRTEREERPERLKRPERLSRPPKQEREPRQERPSKPASVAIRDFEDSLERCINSSGLPPIIIEMVMRGYYIQIKDMAARQTQSEAAMYEESLRRTEDDGRRRMSHNNTDSGNGNNTDSINENNRESNNENNTDSGNDTDIANNSDSVGGTVPKDEGSKGNEGDGGEEKYIPQEIKRERGEE